MRATCLGSLWVVRDRWRWCPVALSGVACPRGWGVWIAQMPCLRRASRMRRATLWCHRQFSRVRLSGGDLVLVHHSRLPTGPHNCLQDLFPGPYRIIKIIVPASM